MRRQFSQRGGHYTAAIASLLFMFGTLAIADRACLAADGGDAPPQMPLRTEIRSGGVIEESYVYHRQQPARMAGAARSVEPVGGWYGYGFPVSTFRWGWFGAAHYYPTVHCHHGYYYDYCRYGYRRGY